jgi:hypothetical protein
MTGDETIQASKNNTAQFERYVSAIFDKKMKYDI